jgi:signal transduction histidine kinase
MPFLLKALKIRESIKDIQGLVKSYANLTIEYASLGKTDKAIWFSQKGLELARGNDYLLMGMYDNIGNLKNILHLYDSALYFYHKELILAKHLKNSDNEISSYLSIGAVYDYVNRNDSVKYYLNMARLIAEKFNSRQALVNILANMGDYELKTGSSTRAIKDYEKEYLLADSIGDVNSVADAFNRMAIAYNRKGDFYNAYIYQYNYTLLHDSLLNEETMRTVAELQQQYETEKKEAQIKDLQVKKSYLDSKILAEHREKELLYFALAALGLIALILIYVYRQKLKLNKLLSREETEENHKKYKALMQQMEENALTSMLDGQENERQRIASELHDNLGSMLSTVKLHFSSLKSKPDDSEFNKAFERAGALLDSACSEVRKIAHNITTGIITHFGLIAAINELRNQIEASGRLKINLFTHNLEQRLEAQTEIYIYRILQELINNCLKHAEASQMDIHIAQYDHTLQLLVEDNGRGFDHHNTEIRKGAGLNNISIRVSKLQGSYHLDTTPGKGTTFVIEIPFNIQKELQIN